MNRAEDRAQGTIVSFLRLVAPHCVVFHVANGGLRSKSEAARLKWMGVLAGVADLVLIAPGGRAHFIEVKAPSGRLSGDQKSFRDWCLSSDVPWVEARGIEDVRAVLARWGISTKEAA